MSRKLSFEASHRESLALKLANDMEGAEARRAKRVQMIVQRNAQRTSAAHVIGRTAKAKAEEKAHAAMAAKCPGFDYYVMNKLDKKFRKVLNDERFTSFCNGLRLSSPRRARQKRP